MSKDSKVIPVCSKCYIDIESKEVGSVTPEERDEIKALFERKNGLNELFRSLTNLDREEVENSYLYEKIVTDMGSVSTKFQNWWSEKNKKYDWESTKGWHWEIDFDTCKISLRNR
jgi:CXXX repeat modification system protein